MVLLCIAFLQGAQADHQDITKVTAEQKKAFLKFIEQLPTRGEFYTAEGVEKASPFLHVLLALDKKDIPDDNYFAIFALSRGLHDSKKQHREFAAKNFSKIPNPIMKMAWGIMLFRFSAEGTPEVTKYLRESLDDPERAKELRLLLGPEYEAVRKQIRAEAAKVK